MGIGIAASLLASCHHLLMLASWHHYKYRHCCQHHQISVIASVITLTCFSNQHHSISVTDCLMLSLPESLHCCHHRFCGISADLPAFFSGIIVSWFMSVSLHHFWYHCHHWYHCSHQGVWEALVPQHHCHHFCHCHHGIITKSPGPPHPPEVKLSKFNPIKTITYFHGENGPKSVLSETSYLLKVAMV